MPHPFVVTGRATPSGPEDKPFDRGSRSWISATKPFIFNMLEAMCCALRQVAGAVFRHSARIGAQFGERLRTVGFVRGFSPLCARIISS